MKDPIAVLTQFLTANPTVQAAWFDDNREPRKLNVRQLSNPKPAALKLTKELSTLDMTIRYTGKINILRLTVDEGPFMPQFQGCQNEPVQLGTQIQPDRANWLGTAGAPVCWLGQADQLHWGFLSNWHVLADGDERIGRTCHQPNNAYPPLGKLAEWSGPDPDDVMHIDAAIADALIDGKHTIANSILSIGEPAIAPVDAAIGMAVTKAGRTTGRTYGKCIGVGASVRVGYGDFDALFEDQDVYEGESGQFSAAGDSGSMILSHQSHAMTSLLFAGSSEITIGNPLRYVVDAFGLVFPFS
jgi:hypothetical protein